MEEINELVEVVAEEKAEETAEQKPTEPEMTIFGKLDRKIVGAKKAKADKKAKKDAAKAAKKAKKEDSSNEEKEKVLPTVLKVVGAVALVGGTFTAAAKMVHDKRGSEEQEYVSGPEAEFVPAEETPASEPVPEESET